MTEALEPAGEIDLLSSPNLGMSSWTHGLGPSSLLKSHENGAEDHIARQFARGPSGLNLLCSSQTLQM